jgi:hypothetical protein
MHKVLVRSKPHRARQLMLDHARAGGWILLRSIFTHLTAALLLCHAKQPSSVSAHLSPLQ